MKKKMNNEIKTNLVPKSDTLTLTGELVERETTSKLSVWMIGSKMINKNNKRKPLSLYEWYYFCAKTLEGKWWKGDNKKYLTIHTCIPLAQSRAISFFNFSESSFFPKWDVKAPWAQYSRTIKVDVDVIFWGKIKKLKQIKIQLIHKKKQWMEIEVESWLRSLFELENWFLLLLVLFFLRFVWWQRVDHDIFQWEHFQNFKKTMKLNIITQEL